jgi:hypothetical protein
MASFTNFLTQGQPLPSSSSTLSTSQVPQYLSDYLYNLMNGAYSAAQQPYQPYNAPRIADFTDPQQQAFQMTQDTVGSYQPGMAAATQTANTGAGLDTLGAAQPYFNQASQTLPSTIGSYMNPYTTNVINQLGTQAAQQLQEKILPQINDEFTRGGQYGSSRQQEIANRGARDISNTLEQNIGSQLAQGYTTAGQQAQADATRLASIGQAAGALTGTQETNAANLANVQAGLAQKDQALGLQGAAALEATGAEQQAMNQQNLNLAYQDFQTQTQYPEQQLGFLSNIVRGLPSGGSTTSGTTSSVGQTYSASPLASLASAGLSAAALGNLLKTS